MISPPYSSVSAAEVFCFDIWRNMYYNVYIINSIADKECETAQYNELLCKVYKTENRNPEKFYIENTDKIPRNP